MLKQRILTAVILIPLVILAILQLQTLWFAALLILVMSVGAWEWAGLSGYHNFLHRAIYVLFFLLLSLVCFYFRSSNFLIIFSIVAIAWWLLVIGLVMRYGKGELSILKNNPSKAGMGFLVLVPAWSSLSLLHTTQPDGKFLVLFLLVFIWIADSAAYFSGRRWGRTKLCPAVSPGKTWEGVLGAVLASIIFTVCYAFSREMQAIEILLFLVICMLTMAISVFGDLMVSIIKREAQMKDSGSLLPGHGGIMDRIDSLTAASPVFLVGLWLIQVVQ